MKYSLVKYILLLFILSTGMVYAQWHGGGNGGGGYQGGDRLQMALGRTDAMIDRAKTIVQESGSERAKQVLKVAIGLQKFSKKLAYQAMQSGDVEMGMRAGNKTLEARAKAERAIAITRQAGENDNYVRRRLEKTQDIINRLEMRGRDQLSQNIIQLIDTAKDKQERAMEFFRNGRLKAALQLTLQVEKSLEKIYQRIGGMGSREKRYQNMLERYYSLRERITESTLGQKDAVQKKLHEAELKQQDAQRKFDAGRYSQAEKTIKNAVEILYRVGERLRDPSRIEKELAILQTKLENLHETVTHSDDSQLKSMYHNVEEHLKKAKTLSGRNKYNAAAAQLQAARQILGRIINYLGE